MEELNALPLELLDYIAFGAFFVVLSLIGYISGRKERASSQEYFLAGRKLPWYVVGSSFIAANISSEHFIGMVGAGLIYGISTSLACWGNIASFSFLIWLFIPFLLASKIYTTPEFLQLRFNGGLRQFFAIVTIISNIVAFLAAVLYGGTLALQALFGWSFWPTIIILGIVAGVWAIYGGLSSVAWTSIPTVIIMVGGGLLVTVLGLYWLSGDTNSFIDGFRIMIERNQANEGVWEEAVAQTAQQIVHQDTYNRLSVIQPNSHELVPWGGVLLSVFSISIWYNALNQFMIQRVLGAKNSYHARMGIVFAGFIQIILPIILVVPGLIIFAKHPEIMKLPWEELRPQADKTWVFMVQKLIPVGLKGLVLAALFGAIQSTVNAVINSTATVFTMDVYKMMLYRNGTDKHYVKVGIITSIAVLIISIVLGGFIERLGGSLFVYIQSLYAFFAPPFAAIFLLGILWRRINSPGATVAVISGFVFGISMKLYIHMVPSHVTWVEPFLNQAAINWGFCIILCIVVSLCTARPNPEQVVDTLVINWRRLRIFEDLGDKWYTGIIFWWGLFALIIIGIVILLSGIIV